MNGGSASEYRAIEVLRDGRSVTIRAQRPDDRADLQEAFGRMGAQSRYFFFASFQSFSATLASLTQSVVKPQAPHTARRSRAESRARAPR